MDTPESSPPEPPAPPQKTSQWPKLIGIIGIIFGALALLQSLVAPFMVAFTRMSMETTLGDSEGAQTDLEEYITELTALSTLSAIVFSILAIILVIGGILLLKRKPGAKPVLMTWAVLKIAAGAFISFKNYGLTRIQMDLISGQAGEGMAAFERITDISATVGLIGGMIWIAALPVFLLIWFSRSKIRREMAEW